MPTGQGDQEAPEHTFLTWYFPIRNTFHPPFGQNFLFSLLFFQSQSSFKDYRRGRRRNPEAARRGDSRTPFVPFGQGSYRTEQFRNTLEKCEEVSENRLDLSLESFPVLQSASKAGPSEIVEISAQFRAFEVSPPKFVSPHVAATDRPASSSMASAFAAPGMVAEKKQQLLESLEEKEKYVLSVVCENSRLFFISNLPDFNFCFSFCGLL